MRKKDSLGSGFLYPRTCCLYDKYFLLEQIIHFHACLTQFKIRSRNRNCAKESVLHLRYRCVPRARGTVKLLYFVSIRSMHYCVYSNCVNLSYRFSKKSEETINCNSTIINLSCLYKVRNEFNRIRHTCSKVLIVFEHSRTCTAYNNNNNTIYFRYSLLL